MPVVSTSFSESARAGIMSMGAGFGFLIWVSSPPQVAAFATALLAALYWLLSIGHDRPRYFPTIRLPGPNSVHALATFQRRASILAGGLWLFMIGAGDPAFANLFAAAGYLTWLGAELHRPIPQAQSWD